MMENTRFDYLRKIGIDVWTLRENVVDIQQPTPETLARKAPQRHPATVPETLTSAPAVSTPESVVNTGAATGIPALRAIAAQLRSSEGKPAALENERSASETKVPATALLAESPGSSASLPPEFLFCFLDYVPENGKGVTLVFSLPHQTQSLPIEVRQFGDDVACSLLGGVHRPNIGELRWPMVKSAYIAQTELEAKAVVLDKVSRCQRNLILFGETSQHYVIGRSSPDAEVLLAPVSVVEQVGEKQVFRALSHLDYCSVDKALGSDIVNRKRALWQLVKEVQKAL
ncbi:MAG: hypothetical protein ACJAVI_001542 [Candidatus Azotimanducaceae bacterium]|jgi:hypothetical protein